MVFSPIIDVTLFSIIIIFVINIFYRLMINQNEARQIKQRVKEMNKKVKEEQKAGNRDNANKLMKEAFQENSKIMKMSMKPMIVSFIIVILILPFMHDLYGDKTVSLNDGTGEVVIGGTTYTLEGTLDEITISDLGECKLPCSKTINDLKWEIGVSENSIKFYIPIAFLPFSLPVVGNSLGWLGWYILNSFLFMTLTRKFLKIYI